MLFDCFFYIRRKNKWHLVEFSSNSCNLVEFNKFSGHTVHQLPTAFVIGNLTSHHGRTNNLVPGSTE